MNRVFSFYKIFTRYEKTVYFVFLCAIFFSFSFWPIVSRLLEIGMVGIFVLGGNYKSKYKNLKENSYLLVFPLFFIFLFISAFYAPDAASGILKLRNHLPWLLFPIIMAGYGSFEKSKAQTLLKVFITGVVLHTLMGIFALIKNPIYHIENFRDIGLYYSHIRFILTVLFGILFHTYLTLKNFSTTRLSLIMVNIVIFTWLVAFLFISNILSGVFSFIAVISAFLLYSLFKAKHLILRICFLAGLCVILVVSAFSLIHHYNLFWGVEEINTQTLPQKTINGNAYTHYQNKKSIENGHYVWNYVCEKELKAEWEERSKIPYKGKITKYKPLKATLIRYLTSKGLKKDSVGVSKLNEKDIKAIEKGIANERFIEYRIADRIYNLAWEIYHSQLAQAPRGTLTGRFFSIKRGIQLWKERFWLGHGLRSAFVLHENKKGETKGSNINNVPVHNQYIKYLIEVGMIGLIMFFIAVFVPYYKSGGYKSLLINYYIIILLIFIMFSNSLKTQLGNSLFIFLYIHLLLHSKLLYRNTKRKPSENNSDTIE